MSKIVCRLLQPDRQWGLGRYRYGFNGKENDSEVKGEGNQQDYGFRIYDPRIAKFLSVDPLSLEYPELTPDQFASNTPIWAIDVDGLEGGIKTMEAWTALKKWWNSSNKISSALAHAWYNGAEIPAEKKERTNGDAIISLLAISGRASMDWHSGALMSGGGVEEIHYTPQAPKTAVASETSHPTIKITDGAVIISQIIRAKKFTAQKDPKIFKSFDAEVIDGKITIPGKGAVNGQFDYILGLDNKLKIGAGHFYLSKGATYVRLAGGLSVKQGVVRMHNNDTGHYLTSVDEGKNGFNFLRSLGLRMDNAWQNYYSPNGNLVVTLPPVKK